MHEAGSMTHLMIKLIFQLSAIIIVAKIFGYIVARYLKQPSVLGELVAGMLIGPYALGGIPIPWFAGEPLFSLSHGIGISITPELYGAATVASIILLFHSGLETDLKTFLRFAGTGALVGLGGVCATFFLGAGSAVFFLADVEHIMDPKALFMGIIATATSVGITARVLSENRKLSSPEGVTILSAAVLDDVLGIILLAVIVGLVKSGGGSESGADWRIVSRIALKAVGFWLGSTVVGILLAPWLTRGLKKLKDMEILAMISFGFALLLAGLSEMAGLAMIVGAYVMGLAFSSTDVAEDIRQQLEGVYSFFVPIFFCVMGMLVNFSVMPKVFVYGIAYTALGIVGKIIGAGTLSLFGGFNLKGALRIGAGMLPRGEVTLIMAGLGLSLGILDSGLFGVAIMTMFLSSLIAPTVILKAFKREGSGFRRAIKTDYKKQKDIQAISLDLPSLALAEFVLSQLLIAFRKAEFFPRRVNSRKPVYTLQKDSVHIVIFREGSTVTINTQPEHDSFVRLLLTEEILALKELFQSVEKIAESDSMERGIIAGLFGVPTPSTQENDENDKL